MAREIKQWITINGVHVPIFEGQSKGQAVRGFLDKIQNKKLDKDTKFKDAKKDSVNKEEKKDNIDDKISKMSDKELKESYALHQKTKEGITNEKALAHHSETEKKLLSEIRRRELDKDEKTKQEQIKKNEEQNNKNDVSKIDSGKDVDKERMQYQNKLEADLRSLDPDSDDPRPTTAVMNKLWDMKPGEKIKLKYTDGDSLTYTKNDDDTFTMVNTHIGGSVESSGGHTSKVDASNIIDTVSKWNKRDNSYAFTYWKNNPAITGSGKAVDSERTSKKVSNSYQEGTYKVTENKDRSEFVVRDGNGRIIGRAPTSKEATHIINQHKEAKVKIKGLNSRIVRLQDEIKKYRAEVRKTDNNYIQQNKLSDAQHELRELFEQLKKWEKFLE